ncbi:GSCOCG00011897001-RA-CDS [Cotesia congregata]|nr:GSCOCG00011897001-RA-CDS [Cotesia congregata]
MGPQYPQQPWQQDQRPSQNQQQQHRQPISNSNKYSDYLRNSGSNNRNRDSISRTINRLGQNGHLFCMARSSEKCIQNIEERIMRRIYVKISRSQKAVHHHDRCVRICSRGNIN